MATVTLPGENAQVPDEEAQQPIVEKQIPDTNSKQSSQNVTFAESTTDGISRNKSTYNNILSQPPRDVTHRQKLIWLQQRRTKGLWAQCDDCDAWRYLPHVLDRHELPAKWYCWMNPETSLATCSAPEVPICLHDEEDLIHAEYAAGSVVLARMPGFPWWPAMVDDCPDTEQYYWLDGFCDIPTHYNVVFFDAHDVTRAWIAPENLMPYKDKTILKISIKVGRYKKRLDEAMLLADDAAKLTLSERLTKYSFIAKYKGKILSPTKIKKRDIQKHQNKLKRQFNVDFPAELSDSAEEDSTPEKTKAKRINVKKTNAPEINLKSLDPESINLTENTTEKAGNTTKDLNSLTVQIDSDSELIKNTLNAASNDDMGQGTATTELHETQECQDDTKSDDFDF